MTEGFRKCSCMKKGASVLLLYKSIRLIRVFPRSILCVLYKNTFSLLCTESRIFPRRAPTTFACTILFCFLLCIYNTQFYAWLHSYFMVPDLERFCASCCRLRQYVKVPKGALSDFNSFCPPFANNECTQIARCRAACCRDFKLSLCSKQRIGL
jgi:hypothetical protein